MKNLQQAADAAYASGSGASAPTSRPTTLAESDKHVAAVARITAQRAQALRNPKGTRYPTDGK
jgi:hypothetical protein